MSEKEQSDLSKPQPPDESQVERLLAGFNPHPSRGFYQKIEATPWRRAVKRERRLRIPAWGAIATATVVVSILLIGILAIPSLQAVAQQIMHYFMPAQADQRSIEMTVPYPDDKSDFGSPAYFSLSLAQAQAQVDFPITQIQQLPSGWAFSGAHYEASLNSITLRYQVNGSTLYLTERLADVVEEYSSVGASAPVETVTVGEVTGEYVLGGWRLASEGSSPVETGVPGTQVSLDIYWDPDLPQQTLRWERGGIVYEIRFAGKSPLSKQVLIEIAESLH
jgi:hypothetical protein